MKEASTEYNAPADYARNNKAAILILEHQPSLRNIVVANAQLYHGSQRDYIREAQALYLLQQASRIIYEFNLAKHKPKMKSGKIVKMTDREKEAYRYKSMPFLMGCDLNSNPSSAAFKVFMGRDCLDPNEVWYRPSQTSELYMDHYKAIELNLKKLLERKKLQPLVRTLQSAYKAVVYSHGQHTSRADTCYSSKCHGMYDHIIFNDSHLKVLQILEIPEERRLAPSADNKPDIDGSMNMVAKLPNSIFPSDHLRIEVEFQLCKEALKRED